MGQNGFNWPSIVSSHRFTGSRYANDGQQGQDCALPTKQKRSHVRMDRQASLDWRKSTRSTSNAFLLQAFLVTCSLLTIFHPTMADELLCLEVCQCSRPSAYPPVTRTSINCSNQSLGDFAQVMDSLYDPKSTGNYTSPLDDRLQEHHLHALDVSHNRLRTVQLVGTGARGGNKSWISIDAIDLSHNFISDFMADNTCMLDGVSTLDLSFNSLETLDNLTWSLCPGLCFLMELNLSHNSLEDVGNTSFSSFTNLVSLDLSFNQLREIPATSFDGLVSLKYLYLRSNDLNGITDVFSHLPNLLVLDLSNNVLDNIPTNVFSKLNSLKNLSLADNRIPRLEAEMFDGLVNLVELSLDQNLLTSLDESVFENTPNLQSLSLNSMPRLVNVSHRAFSGLSHLTHLNMSNNQQLNFLQPNTLLPMGSLQVIDLSHSGFQQLSSTTFLSPQLRQVYLRSLPLSCVCTNSWFVEERLKNDSVFVDLAAPYSCIDANNQSVDIAQADFKCGAVHINSTTGVVAVHLGSKLLLQCQLVMGDMAVLTWTTPSDQKFYHHNFHPDSLSHLLGPDEVTPDAPFHRTHYWHQSSSYHSEISSHPDRILILTDGSLYIDYMLRQDAGEYTCEAKNSFFNHSLTVTLHLEYDVSGRIKIFAFIVGFLCALGFFALNVVYVIISWIARRLVNKRRRETILQMLENLNAYKSMQITRIHENYTYQLNRVRNQYHIQRDKLHKNYTGQVTRVKRGCSHQVERVRENYHSKLAHLREYSSRQIMQIRESANNQIGRIRDYGSLQLDRLRETYKLQQRHVMKLLDTMNLDNCRSVIETECMRTESMMFDIDLLEADVRVDSPTSPESEYNTAASSPNTSDDFMVNMEEQDLSDRGEYEDLSDRGEYDPRNQGLYSNVDSHSTDNESHEDDIEIEMNRSLSLAGGIHVDAKEVWKYTGEGDNVHDHVLYTNVHGPVPNKNLPLRQKQNQSRVQQSQSSVTHNSGKRLDCGSELAPLPLYTVSLQHHRSSLEHPIPVDERIESLSLHAINTSNDENWSGSYVTPEASPIKFWPQCEPPNEFEVNLDNIEVQSENPPGQRESEL